LKTKLVGVLGGCFIKAGGEYKSVYDSYKAHISTLERHADKTKKHIHNMAVRYMIRTFLIHFWTEWRKLEGLPVSLPYEAAKLGKVVSLPSPQKSNDNPKTEPKAKYQFIQQ
jgi:hypothetical protein